ncbi:MAG: response regulator [Proteobacteria bacterium]|nr:response regulator [Pseudomonadota bacterium]
MDNLSVVIAEDDPKISEIQSRFIEKIEGFDVVGIGNTIEESEQIIDVFQPDLVLLDYYFPDGNGVDLLWKIRRLYKNTDVIFITAAKEVGVLQDAIRGGAFDYILKPMTFSRFQSTLGKFLDHRNKIGEMTRLDQTGVDQIIHPAEATVQTDVRMPKSIDPLTLEKVEDEVNKLNDDGVNAEAMGLQLGISRTTARRYLEFLVSKGIVKPSLVYGSVGRPERLYFQANSKT